MTLKFRVPGLAVAKGRPRTTKVGRMFTDQKTINYENLVRACFGAAYPGFIPVEKPIKIYMLFTLPIPQGAKRKSKPDKIQPGDPCLTRPDLDNLMKSVLDGLNTVAYQDDKWIAEVYAKKVYGEAPDASIVIQSIGRDA